MEHPIECIDIHEKMVGVVGKGGIYFYDIVFEPLPSELLTMINQPVEHQRGRCFLALNRTHRDLAGIRDGRLLYEEGTPRSIIFFNNGGTSTCVMVGYLDSGTM